MTPDAKFFHAFNLVGEIGPVSFNKLLKNFSNLENAWAARFIDLQKAGLSKPALENIRTKHDKIDPDQELIKLKNDNIDLICLNDQNYPKLLKEIYQPPALLYILGNILKDDEFSLAIVGTRKATYYGQQITPTLTNHLCQAGLTIISGLAKGIDTLAHQAALAAGGRTIAVLGSGLNKNCLYPKENRSLAQTISHQGAVISEYPPLTNPKPQYFPQRNRLIAGLSLGTLVIEAPEKSGALITAHAALENNREVFAVPGSILSENSAGNNYLIKMGAKLVSQANDILEEFNLALLAHKPQKNQLKADSQEETLILNCLSREPLHVDKIILQTKLSPSTINATLSLMEIKNKIKNLGNNHYILNQ